jgi:Lysozyme like domain
MKLRASPLLILAVLFVLSSSKGGARGGSSPVTGDKLGRLTLAQVRALAATVGFPDPDLAAAVAYAESQGFPHVIGDNGNSYGLWQVNIPWHPEYRGREHDLTDPTFNAQAALAIFQAGGWTKWSTFNDGKHLQYMPAKGGAA